MSQADTRFSRRAIAAATVGNALEFYDFVTFAFFAVQIGQTFFPSGSAFVSLMGALATFGAGFVTRPIGALVLGTYADRVGRKPAMVLSFTMMGGAIAVLALTPGYASIGIAAPTIAILARMVQGFSLGGEVGSSTAYMMETAPPHRRGLAVSFQGTSQEIAGALGSLAGLMLSLILSAAALQSYGWRIALLLGVVTVPFGLIVRRGLPETLHLEEPEGISTAIVSVAIRDHLRIILLGFAVFGSSTIATYIFKYLATYGQTTLHLSAAISFAAAMATSAISVVCMPIAGLMSDRFGRKPLIIWGYAAFVATILPIFLWVTHERGAVSFILGMLILSAISCFPIIPFYVTLTESLPKAIRTRVFALVYSLAIASLGGTTQLVVTWLIHVTGSAMAPAWYLTGATAIGLLAATMLPESAPTRRATPLPPMSEPPLAAA